MRVAYSSPARGEHYSIGKNAAVRLVRSLCPDVPVLAFQTMHGPKMSREILYLATFSPRYIRILSMRDELICEELLTQFHERILPYICAAVVRRERDSYFWPTVIVGVDGMVVEVTCSDGGLFPDADEIRQRMKKNCCTICSYDSTRVRSAFAETLSAINAERYFASVLNVVASESHNERALDGTSF